MWPSPPSWGSCCLHRTLLLVECEANESGGGSLCKGFLWGTVREPRAPALSISRGPQLSEPWKWAELTPSSGPELWRPLSSVTRDRKGPKVQVPNMSWYPGTTLQFPLPQTSHMTCHKELPGHMKQDLTSGCKSPRYPHGGASTHLSPLMSPPGRTTQTAPGDKSGPNHERYLGRPSSEYYAGHE